ncbi:hypothetical protein SAMN04488024_103396 [Pedobacter soli]|uniref:Uncharacterized protein n=1 Tax=Pedobacter soli TaxID=390242 RepID=A0A1G6QN01_9SPHI|nr:hypothetical protein SAMN04488024_103396 [Pedobacter soli]
MNFAITKFKSLITSKLITPKTAYKKPVLSYICIINIFLKKYFVIEK